MIMLKKYITVIKPGIVLSNLMVAVTGFLLASSEFGFDLILFLSTMVGVLLILASATAINNYLDQDIDEHMTRTKERLNIVKSIGSTKLLTYGITIGVLGFLILYFAINWLTCVLGLLGFGIYILAYTMYLKRHSIHSTWIGSISGGMLPMMGYTAVTNSIDLISITLFLILAIWQMPHFYAIGIYRQLDYSLANIAILPVKKGIIVTKQHIIIWTILLCLVSVSLYFVANLGIIYLLFSMISSVLWLRLMYFARRLTDAQLIIPWARKVFFYSIIFLLTFSLFILLDLLFPY